MVRGETNAYRRTTEQIVGVDSCAGLVVVDAFMVEFYVQTRVSGARGGRSIVCVPVVLVLLVSAGTGSTPRVALFTLLPLLDPGQRACLLYLHSLVPPKRASLHACSF